MLEDGDILMYADAGCRLVGHPQPWLDVALQYGATLLVMSSAAMGVDVRQRLWTKGDVFSALGMSMDEWGDLPQITTPMVLVKNPATVAFIEEWLLLCRDSQLLTDEVSMTPNDPGFRDHRHDQSLFSMLAYKRDFGKKITDTTWPTKTAPVLACGRWRD
jgi:hypothetical protein